MNRSVVVRELPAFEGREIVISDIHGNLSLYKKLLRDCGYQHGTDRLILAGDLVEKGPENLAMLRYVMEQTRTGNVWCLMGNCDFTAKNVLYSYRLSFLRSVVSGRQSLISEMAREIGISMESMDMDEFCHKLRETFLPELSFLADLPHVLVSHRRIYAHAAIMNETTFGSDFREVMTTPFFLHAEKRFSRPVIVGHMPVSEYHSDHIDFSPIYDPERNIWSIDGGNIVKTSGQLNAVIFEGEEVRTVSADALPKARVARSVDPGLQIPFAMSWNHRDVEVRQRERTQSLVFSPWLRRSFWIDNLFLERDAISEYTNYRMPVSAGEDVGVVMVCHEDVLVKKRGRLGWVPQDALELPEVNDSFG